MNQSNSPESNSSASGNSYLDQQTGPATSQTALDSSAPSLKSTDSQRVNKKALLFLGGILLLMALMAILLWKSRSGNKEEAPPVKEEQVVVPALPGAPGGVANTASESDTPPIDVAASTAPPLPAMPVSDPMYMPPPPPAQEQMPRGPTLLDRRMMSSGEGYVGASSEKATTEDAYLKAILAAQNGGQPAAPAEPPPTTSAMFLNRPDTLLLRGTYIRCVLETRIITDVNGYTSCLVTEPVYSVNGRRLLLPKGSKVLGQYGSGEIKGERIAVVWDRMITTTGVDVSMASPGVDNLGSAGYSGDYTAHWAQRIGSALFISLLSDAFKYYGEKEGPQTITSYPGTGGVVQEPFKSNTARTIERLANQAVEKSANRQPTITIHQGTIVNIYVSQDVDFSAVVR